MSGNPQFKERCREVLVLERECIRRGYKAGWTYYRCEEYGLLNEFYFLQRRGDLQRLRAREGVPSPASESLEYQKALAEVIPGTVLEFPSLELLPTTCRGQNLRNLLYRRDWEFLRQLTFERANFRCQVCVRVPNKGKLHCHETWHYDDQRKVQKLVHLIALCEDCHDVKHLDLAHVKGRADKAFRHFACISGESDQSLREYFERQLELRDLRSSTDWVLDVGVIRELGIFPSVTASIRGVCLEGRDGRGAGRFAKSRGENFLDEDLELMLPPDGFFDFERPRRYIAPVGSLRLGLPQRPRSRVGYYLRLVGFSLFVGAILKFLIVPFVFG